VFWYFGYGSNMDLQSLRAKGVVPRISERAVLRGWRLRFNVRHFFRHEGGVGNIEPSNNPVDLVWGVLHLCDDNHLVHLDAAEAYGHGYDRILVEVDTARQGSRKATTYVGMPSFLDESCRPTQRYLNIVLQGAVKAGIDPSYVEQLRRYPLHLKKPVAPFAYPKGDFPTFTARTLAERPLYTALACAVFDMSGARSQHEFLKSLFGGKDMTLFHLQRLDQSDGTETLEDIKHNRLTPAQKLYLDEYLHEYMMEYVYVGRFCYGSPSAAGDGGASQLASN
jgi:sulfite reductase (NADPH) flavoprotein alpha-component